MGTFRKGKTCIMAKFHRTDLVICGHSREGKTLLYGQINMVYVFTEKVEKLSQNYRKNPTNPQL